MLSTKQEDMGMEGKILIILLLILLSSPAALAATTASQTITATLAIRKQVVDNGGNLRARIIPTTGNLDTALTPAFKITTNTNAAQNLDLGAFCDGQTTQNAVYDRAGSRLIILANTTVLPTDAAINNCKAALPTPSLNANAISFPIVEPSDIPGQLTYSYNLALSIWNATLTHKGNTYTNLVIPAAVPLIGTFSDDDKDGYYLATVTLAFNP